MCFDQCDMTLDQYDMTHDSFICAWHVEIQVHVFRNTSSCISYLYVFRVSKHDSWLIHMCPTCRNTSCLVIHIWMWHDSWLMWHDSWLIPMWHDSWLIPMWHDSWLIHMCMTCRNTSCVCCSVLQCVAVCHMCEINLWSDTHSYVYDLSKYKLSCHTHRNDEIHGTSWCDTSVTVMCETHLRQSCWCDTSETVRLVDVTHLKQSD